MAMITSQATQDSAGKNFRALRPLCSPNDRCYAYADARMSVPEPWVLVLQGTYTPPSHCCKNSSFFCTQHRRATLALQYRYLPAIRHALTVSAAAWRSGALDWLVLIDDDSIVNPPRLLETLLSVNTSQSWYLGDFGRWSISYERLRRITKDHDQLFWSPPYACGGAGTIFTRVALLQMDLDRCIKRMASVCFQSDWAIGMCAAESGVPPLLSLSCGTCGISCEPKLDFGTHEQSLGYDNACQAHEKVNSHKCAFGQITEELDDMCNIAPMGLQLALTKAFGVHAAIWHTTKNTVADHRRAIRCQGRPLETPWQSLKQSPPQIKRFECSASGSTCTPWQLQLWQQCLLFATDTGTSPLDHPLRCDCSWVTKHKCRPRRKDNTPCWPVCCSRAWPWPLYCTPGARSSQQRNASIHSTKARGVSTMRCVDGADVLPPSPTTQKCLGFVVMVTVNAAYFTFFLNWLHHARHSVRVLEKCLVAIAEDELAVVLLRRVLPAANILPAPRVLSTRNATFGPADYGSSRFGFIVSERLLHVLSFLLSGLGVLYCDLDVVWRRGHAKPPAASVLSLVELQRTMGFHVVATDDHWNLLPCRKSKAARRLYLCTCLLYIPPTDLSVSLVRSWQAVIAREKTSVNQFAFNHVVRHDPALRELRVAVLNRKNFPSGKLWNESSPRYRAHAAIVHANYVKGGLHDKRKRLIEAGAWAPHVDKEATAHVAALGCNASGFDGCFVGSANGYASVQLQLWLQGGGLYHSSHVKKSLLWMYSLTKIDFPPLPRLTTRFTLSDYPPLW